MPGLFRRPSTEVVRRRRAAGDASMETVMTRLSLLLVLTTILPLDGGSSPSQLTLPDRARANHGQTIQRMGLEFDAATIPKLTATANVIVYGAISSVETVLSADEMAVLTVYTITPLRLLKESAPVSAALRPQQTKLLRVE